MPTPTAPVLVSTVAPVVAPVVAVELSDVSLTVMVIGAIVLAGATVVVTALPDVRWPRRRRGRSGTEPAAHPPAVQRRVVTGRAVVLPPPGAPLPRQTSALPDGRRTMGAEAARAEAMIDHFLETDPQMLAATMSAMIAQDDKRRRRGHR